MHVIKLKVQATEVLFLLFPTVINGTVDIVQEGLGAMEYVHKTGSKALVCEELIIRSKVQAESLHPIEVGIRGPQYPLCGPSRQSGRYQGLGFQ